MQYRPFGSMGQQVSVIGMGTWYIDLADRDTAIRALQTGLDHGMNHIAVSYTHLTLPTKA